MTGIRGLSAITEKYKRVTPGKAKELEEGIRNPKKNWEEQTSASSDAYNDGVQEAIARNAFSGGVKATGQSGYLEMALKKGPKRYREGVEIGLPKYQRNFAPFRDTIAATELSPRKATGDPGNIARVAEIAAALHEEKRRRQTGG